MSVQIKQYLDMILCKVQHISKTKYVQAKNPLPAQRAHPLIH